MLITDVVARANIFNKYFASVFTCDDCNIPKFCSCIDAPIECCDVSFTALKIMQVLKGLKPKYSSRPDGFPNILFKKLARSLCSLLAFIFQASFRSRVTC